MLNRNIALIVCLIGLVPSAHAQRLPATVLPEHYQITFAPDLKAATFTGDETIQAQVLAETSSIMLNAAEIEFGAVTVTSANKTQDAKVSLDPNLQQATLTVADPIPAGPAEIHIRFTGKLNDQLRGFYLVKTARRNLAATQFEATDARRAFPCFDEPAMKATFALRLVVDRGDTAISNGRIVSDTPGPGEPKHTLAFSETPKMSSYLVAMAVGDFQCVEGSSDGIPIRVCATPDKKELGAFALEAAEHILHYYDNYYALKYPYGKLDLVAVPDFAAGAMENTAAIFFRESLLLVDPQRASARLQEQVASVLAHEMAHMWFGDLVTMKWWDDLWLNEGFATWMAPKPLQAWKPEWNPEMSALQETVGALAEDSYGSTHAIRTPANTPDQILELADEITYGKAADVLRMVEAYLGEETFRRGANTYLEEHAYGNATAADFWNTLTRVSGKPVDKIMKSFVDQPGAPMISAKGKQEGTKTQVELAQRRFYFDRQKLEAGSNELWQIPVCMKEAAAAGEEAKETCELLGERRQSYALAAKFPWVLINAGARGYYRSSYQPEAWKGIASAAERQLSPAERLMFLVDGWSMVRAGKLDIGDFMPVLDDYSAERKAAVMATLGGILREIGDDLAPGKEAEPYRAWVRSLLRPAMKELGWNPAPGESDDRRSLRSSVIYTLGYAGHDPEVLRESRLLVEKYMHDPSAIDPSLTTTVVRLAARHGDEALYNEYLAHLQNAKTPDDHDRFLFSLASFDDPALLIRTIQYAKSGGVHAQNATFLIGAVLMNSAGRPTTWNYVKDHWAMLSDNVPEFAGGALVEAAGDVCDAAARDDVESFLSSHQVPASQRTIQHTEERMNLCVDLRSRQEAGLASWLQGWRSAAGQ
jgi:puromycin-sensitive aminopeptidase